MGMDFAAFIRYPGPTPQTLDTIEALTLSSISELRKVLPLWIECGFSDMGISSAGWIDRQNRRVSQPSLPCLSTSLCLPEGFFLTFGSDTLFVNHPLRWLQFLQDERWQRIMLAASAALARCFHGSACVVTSDYSPLLECFSNGMKFDDSLVQVHDKEPAVENVKQLLIEGIEGYPKGTWSSKGYLIVPVSNDQR